MLTPVTLRGRIVSLEPMTMNHAAALCEAASEDRSTYTYTTTPEGIEETERYIEKALSVFNKGSELPFVVRHLATDRIAGTTRFLDLQIFTWPPLNPPDTSISDANPPTVAEIGYTWYAASMQRSGVNTESKLLMLEHAFDTWHAQRITLKTDARNERSRAAIARLGATFEGIRRAHMPASDGTIRDSAYYSILAKEWPAVRKNLQERLVRGNQA